MVIRRSPKCWAVRLNGTVYVISDCAELETFASQFSSNSVYAFSMGYRSQKSRAEGADFCDMFRTILTFSARYQIDHLTVD